MAGRFTRFMRIERPHQPGEQHTPVANAERFAPEEPRTPGSGIEIDEAPADEQPFMRCAQCEIDNTRYAQRCSKCGAALHTPEQDLYNRQLWQKRRAEAQAEHEALQRMRQPPVTPDPGLARQDLRKNDPRYALGEVLAEQMRQREEDKLFWMTGTTGVSGVPLGVRIATAMPSRWRWRVGAALLCWLGGTGAVALLTHHPTPTWLFFGTVILLVLMVSPARPRRRFWWSQNDWW